MRPRTPHAGDGEAPYYCQMKTLILEERTQTPHISQEFYSTYSEKCVNVIVKHPLCWHPHLRRQRGGAPA